MERSSADRFRRRDYAAINALWIGVQFQEAALLSIVVPALVLRLAPATHTAVLALLSTVAALAATLVPPFVGALSDAARRGGSDRRRQTALYLAIDAVALVAMAAAGNVPLLAVALALAIACQNAAATVYQVLVPEIVPRAAWGTAAGVRGALTLLGTIGGLAVAALVAPAAALLATAALIVVCALSLRLVPRAPADAAPRPHAVVRDRRDLSVTLVARAWIVLGMTLLNTYVLYFFSDVLGYRDASAGTGLVAGAALIGAIASSIWTGTLSDRVDRRLIVALSGIPMVAAASGFALVPDVHFIFAYALLFGLGYGGVFSVGWALALDAIPELGDVARDLGIWGTLSNLPAIVAPAIGAAIIAHGATPADGYRALFAAAALSFALGSLTVLRVGRRSFAGPLLLAAIWVVHLPLLALHVRVRQWGRLPRRRGPTLLLLNHQHEDETEILDLRTFADGPWTRATASVGSRRMFEAGFLAERMPWSAPVTRRLGFGWFFRAIGLHPLENQLAARPLGSLGREIAARHGDLPLDAIFAAPIASDGARRLSDLQRPRFFDAAQRLVKLSALREPHRSEALAALRASVAADLARIEATVRDGATFLITPEGRYSTDGRLHPLKGIVDRLAPLADVWLAATAFDPFRGRRLGMLYRVVRPANPADLATSLAAARPVTTSALVADALLASGEPPDVDGIARAVAERRAALPPAAFVDPEYDAQPERCVAEALAHLAARAGDRRDPRFPQVADMLAFQATFFRETRAALLALYERARLQAE